jgi:predicted metal-dependent peptidase
MTDIKKKELLNEYSWATSRLITKTLPIISKTHPGIDLIDLLMGLPITFELNEFDPESIPEGVDPKTLAIGGYIKRDTERGNPDRLIVFITLSKVKDITWDTFFESMINDQYYHNTIAFIYMHEAMHILLRHYDFYLNQSYDRIITDMRSDMDEKSRMDLLNMAFDFWINAYLLEQAASGTVFDRWQNDPDTFTGLYDVNLSPQHMTMQEVVVKLVEEAKVSKTEISDTDGNVMGQLTSVTIHGNTTNTFSPNGQHQISTNEREERPTGAEQEVDEILASVKNDLTERTRGEDSTGAFEKLGVDYTVPTDWFKALKGSVFSIVQKHTNRYDSTWGKIRNKYRHIALLPGRIYYEQNLAAIISIDQSGSMSNSDLEKINYVVTKLAAKTVFTEIMLHDTKVAKTERFKGKRLNSIREFVTTRHACGGTSHKEVFENIARIKQENPKLKFIYLSFSDNYSDIEQVYDPQTFQGVNSYWITTEESNTVKVPGMQISLEHGLLT